MSATQGKKQILAKAFDEMGGADTPLPHYQHVHRWLAGTDPDYLAAKEREAELLFRKIGITFSVYSESGYEMLVGPHASAAEREAFAQKLKAHPGDYIAQPTLALSTCPTYVESGVAPRHVDLRPFVLYGREIKIVPGGLTRVALREGSLVVYRRDTLKADMFRRIGEDDEYFKMIRERWSEALREAYRAIPHPNW